MSTESGHAPNWEDCQHSECLSERGIEEGMTPELEAKAWLREMDAVRDSRGDAWHLTKINKDVSTAELMEMFAASQLSAERKWWITRIERERDKYRYAGIRDQRFRALDDLLTSVRERGGK